MTRAAEYHERNDIRKARGGAAAHAHEARGSLRGLCHREFLERPLGGTLMTQRRNRLVLRGRHTPVRTGVKWKS